MGNFAWTTWKGWPACLANHGELSMDSQIWTAQKDLLNMDFTVWMAEHEQPSMHGTEWMASMFGQHREHYLDS
jgi:hypothetical protein